MRAPNMLRRLLPIAAGAMLARAAIGCSGDAATDSVTLPTREASAMRELEFTSMPALRVISQESALAEIDRAERPAARATRLEPYRLVGFFRAGQEPLDSVARASFEASYSSVTRTITSVGTATPDVLVHELVHALQDQHFDLGRLDREATSSDEMLAIRALVEGDAALAQGRYQVSIDSRDPLGAVPPFVSATAIDRRADDAFATATSPPYFSAYQLFTYAYGAGYVASAMGLFGERPTWNTSAINSLFDHVPRSTQEIIRRGVDVDPIVPVGLAEMPPALADAYEVDAVDRLGEWLTLTLLSPVVSDRYTLRKTTAAWDGDQLVVLRERDRSVPPSPSAKRAVVWTSTWDDDASAEQVAVWLKLVHGAVPDASDPSGHALRAADGETLWVEQKNQRVVLAKNLSSASLPVAAGAALATETTPLPTNNSVMRTPHP